MADVTDVEFEFADFDINSKEWDSRSKMSGIVVNPSSDNGRSAWSEDSED